MKRMWIKFCLLLGCLLSLPPIVRSEVLHSFCSDRYHIPTNFLANPDESDLIARVIGWCRNQKARMLWDERYASVARSWSEHLLQSNPSTERMLPIDRLRFDLQLLGVTDAHIVPHSFTATPGAQPKSLTEFLDREVLRGRYNIFGIGVARTRDQKQTASTLLIGRRPAILDPIPVCPLPAERLQLRLRLVTGYRHPTWLLTQPEGSVISGTLTHQEGFWYAKIPLDSGRGVYKMEVLVHGHHGPEIAALYPLYVGVERPRLPIVKLHPAPVRYRTPKEAEKALTNMIDMERSRHHLPSLVVDENLSKVARHHSLQLLNSRHAVHRTTTTGSLNDRLRHAKIRFLRALENVSLSASPEGAHERFLESPSHRLNLLDPHVTHLGVGIAMERGSQEDILAVCEVYVEKPLSADISKLVGNLLEMINKKRKKRGRFALGFDKQLSRYARDSARRMANGSIHTDPQQESTRILESISNSRLMILDVRIRIFCTSNPRKVLSSPELLDENINRIGIGVAKTRDQNRPEEFWISLIFAGR